MDNKNNTPPEASDGQAEYVAVIDIGSNSVRLVVYDGGTFIPVPFFNEKVLCGLGRGLGQSGRLNTEGVAMARACLARFIGLARAMNVRRLDLLATAATRDAEDGPAFVAEIEDRFGVSVRVLPGEEEAKLSAQGLVAGHPRADGLMGDLGGGSLDLVVLDEGRCGNSASLPLGALRMAEAGRGSFERARDFIDHHLDTVPWIADALGRTFFPIGGAWRAFARVAITHTRYPLHVIDGFPLARSQAEDLAHLIGHLGPRSLEHIPGISSRRLETLPLAALLMERVLVRAKPSKVLFSAFGMREGQYFKVLIPAARDTDPMINACHVLGSRNPRFAGVGAELRDWTRELFHDEDADEARIRFAACLLSDVGWADHPEYRADQAFNRVLRFPFAGLTHAERAFLAVTVLVRHRGDKDLPQVEAIRRLLTPELEKRARVLGQAFRLAHTLCGGIAGLLARTSIRRTGSNLILALPEDESLYMGEAVERRLAQLARGLDLDPVIVHHDD